MIGTHKEGDTQGTQTGASQGECNETEGHIEIKPHFGNNVELFDNEDLFPDLEFVVPGLNASLHLHKLIITRASRLMEGQIKSKQIAESQDRDQVQWMFDTNEKVDRDALVKVLRFCYGDEMKVETTNCECCAIVAALYRLQVTCADEVVKKLTECLVNRAKNDVTFGAMLLEGTQHYPECCGMKGYELDKALAKVALTGKNICEHFETVVSGCLMKLPPDYLSIAEYGEAHTGCSEFSVKTLYLKEHSESLSQEEKEEIMRKCNLTFLGSGELKELRKLNVVGSDLLLDMHESVLERTEKEKSDNGMKTSEVTQKRDEHKTSTEEGDKEKDEPTNLIVDQKKDEETRKANKAEPNTGNALTSCSEDKNSLL